MSTNPEPNELLVVAQGLTEHVEILSRKLTLTEQQNKRQQRWIYVTWGLLAGLVVALVFTFNLYQTVKAAVADNKANAVTNCQNANESRAGNSVRWNYVIDLSASNPNIKPDVAAYLETVRTWMNKLDAARDCSDLSRKYPLPDPPPLLKRAN